MRFARKRIRGADVLRDFQAVYEYCFWLAPLAIRRYSLQGIINNGPEDLEDFCHMILTNLLVHPELDKIPDAKAWISHLIRLELERGEKKQQRELEMRRELPLPQRQFSEQELVGLRLDVERILRDVTKLLKRHSWLGTGKKEKIVVWMMTEFLPGNDEVLDRGWTRLLKEKDERAYSAWQNLRAALHGNDTLRMYAGYLTREEQEDRAIKRAKAQKEKAEQSEKRWRELQLQWIEELQRKSNKMDKSLRPVQSAPYG